MIDNSHIHKNERSSNNAGIDPDECQNAIIVNCIIQSRDDSMAVRATAVAFACMGVKNIRIQKFILEFIFFTLKIGTDILLYTSDYNKQVLFR